MEPTTKEKDFRLIFFWSLILKGLNAVLEIIGGLLFLSTGTATKLVKWLIQGELIEDPADVVANFIQSYIPYVSEHTQVFAAIYLLTHGVIKIFLVIALLRNKLWAYPTAIAVFSGFIAYQVFRYSYTGSMYLILLTIFDFFVVWLTWHEYNIVKKRIVNRENAF